MKIDLVKHYEDFGWIKLHNIFSTSFINETNYCIDHLEPSVTLPFTDIPWGYGNLIESIPFKHYIQNDQINSYLNSLFLNGYHFNHLMVNEKAPYYGPNVEWHQESSNINTFAPGSNWKDDWKKFAQVYIALDNQDSTNGGLKVFSKSHKLGLLKHYDIISPFLTHKRQIVPKELFNITDNCDYINIDLCQGDVLIFNHLLIHGSGQNTSANRRRSIVLQARSNKLPKFNNSNYIKETNYRLQFIISNLESKIDELKHNNIYMDFNNVKE